MKEEAIEVGIVQATFSQVFGLIGLLTLASLLLPLARIHALIRPSTAHTGGALRVAGLELDEEPSLSSVRKFMSLNERTAVPNLYLLLQGTSLKSARRGYG